MMKRRVDRLPLWMRPVVGAYGTIGALGFTAVINGLRVGCHWKHATPENRRFDRRQPCLHVTWHENVPAYLCSYTATNNHSYSRHVWLQHPAAYMKPIHTFLKWNNVDTVLGSSGNSGQEALGQLQTKLMNNASGCIQSSAFFPDGPAGPVHKVKLGVIQVAQATGLPIVPIQFDFGRSWRTGWDQKHFPIPGSTITIHELEPFYVTKDDDVFEMANELERVLG